MNITSFLLYCFIITVTPGPTNIVILSTTNHYGFKRGLKYTYGSTIAFFILLVLSALFNTVLALWIPKILLLMQMVGTAYMLYLAYQIYKMDTAGGNNNKTGDFSSGFMMQFLNPKVLLFTFTVIPSFVLPYYDAFLPLSLSVLVITSIGFISFLLWVLVGTVFQQFLQNHQKIANTIMAICLIYAAVMMWF
ncbi:LysE family transporter [Metasolibacillus meyeri]|uniref:LysE family transporter n=1 Tax=Metasolibacillus meyeri TaxID=1071052 RepID=A0AAW9NY70_9BACL|nr:LysE family transporter [Metasolibacillus meyeri]MEC1180586.1 LysE family transporter [Metasolibacillus meyeri]